MAGGGNHAKQTVLKQADKLVQKLNNGSAGCLETQGNAMALMLDMLRPLYENEFVTVEDCKKKCKTGVFSTFKVGSVSIKAPITFIAILIPYGGIFFALGKAVGWW